MQVESRHGVVECTLLQQYDDGHVTVKGLQHCSV